ncbi:hypothetical protein GCM10009808_03170 [Microbacterium sediminicola]|uniref:ADP-dependent (S)-NAD(P)H-hydrate dehydratase n=1 Tax=Microbacterium sediminicola TaxID=415210 RepID=A0ABP4TM41_9MICO
MTGGWDARATGAVLRAPGPTDDKYTRGVVGMRTGSRTYPGAAVLGVEAAWRTGIGMVRYLGASRAARLVLQRRPETVIAPGRVQSWVIGSGTDPATRTASETRALREVLAGSEPVVVDAGALDLASEAHAPMIVTPHASEHERLRRMLDQPPGGEDPLAAANDTAQRLGAVVVLKGAATVIAAPGSAILRMPVATSWLATAGTGDVLAGIVGAVVAGARAADRAAPLAACAAAGVWLHSRAAGLASEAVGGGPIVALDVAAHVPQAVAEALRAVR